jgi:hypothetical protein
MLIAITGFKTHNRIQKPPFDAQKEVMVGGSPLSKIAGRSSACLIRYKP